MLKRMCKRISFKGSFAGCFGDQIEVYKASVRAKWRIVGCLYVHVVEQGIESREPPFRNKDDDWPREPKSFSYRVSRKLYGSLILLFGVFWGK